MIARFSATGASSNWSSESADPFPFPSNIAVLPPAPAELEALLKYMRGQKRPFDRTKVSPAGGWNALALEGSEQNRRQAASIGTKM